MKEIKSEIERITRFLDHRLPLPPLEIISSGIIYERYLNVNVQERKRDIIRISMWTWIDQTIYFLLADERNENCFNDIELYNNFRNEFPFPKVEISGAAWGNISPAAILKIYDDLNLIFEKELLLISKLQIWDLGVKRFFEELGRIRLVIHAENEFRKDLKLRHRFTEDEESRLKFLWKEELFN